MLSTITKPTNIGETISVCQDRLESIIGLPVRVFYRIEPKVTIGRLINLVEEEFKIPWNVITGKSRKAEVKLARQVFCWIAAVYIKSENKDTGFLINRDRTCVSHTINHVKDMIEVSDMMYVSRIQSIEEKLMKL